MLETIAKFDLVNMAKINRDGPGTSIGLGEVTSAQIIDADG
jgi:hypothetical protein